MAKQPTVYYAIRDNGTPYGSYARKDAALKIYSGVKEIAAVVTGKGKIVHPTTGDDAARAEAALAAMQGLAPRATEAAEVSPAPAPTPSVEKAPPPSRASSESESMETAEKFDSRVRFRYYCTFEKCGIKGGQYGRFMSDKEKASHWGYRHWDQYHRNHNDGEMGVEMRDIEGTVAVFEVLEK